MQEFVCLYGFPAAGKTTFAYQYVREHPEFDLISADAVRKDLYGSQDHYGEPAEIYQVLLERIKSSLRVHRSVLYDGTNLKRQDRIDFLRDIRLPSQCGFEFDGDIKTTIIKLPTTKNTCIERHLRRNRNIPIESLLPYFSIQEPPFALEGWDHIYTCCTTAYIAAPFFEEKDRANAIRATEILRSKGIDTYLPLEHKIENAWDLPNYEWGRQVFENDIRAIQNCDTVIVLSYGRMASAGTSWEAGYAFGIGKRVIIVEMPGVDLMSLMVANGRYATLRGLDGLERYDFIQMPQIFDDDIEQK